MSDVPLTSISTILHSIQNKSSSPFLVLGYVLCMILILGISQPHVLKKRLFYISMSKSKYASIAAFTAEEKMERFKLIWRRGTRRKAQGIRGHSNVFSRSTLTAQYGKMTTCEERSSFT